MLASARVAAQALGRWHTLRVVGVGNRIRGSLDGKLLLDHRDTRLRAGRVDDFTIRGVAGAS
jgi:hypothetical protein